MSGNIILMKGVFFMSKKVTDYIKIEEELFTQNYRNNYDVILSIDVGKEDRTLEKIEIEPEIEFNTWQVYMDKGLKGLQAKFMFCYAVLFFLQNVGISTFTFFSKKHKFSVETKEELERMLEEAWYENNHFHRYIIEENKILTYIDEELEGKSVQTKQSYRKSLKAFYKHLFLKERESFPAFQEGEVNRYIDSLHKKGRAASYLTRIFAAINGYAAYQGIVLNPKKISIPQPDKKLKDKFLKDEKLKEINSILMLRFAESQQSHAFKQFPNTGKQRDEYRNLVLFRLMLACGLRAGEALNLTIDDLYLDGKRSETRYVHVRETKTSEERFIPLDKTMTQLLKEYITFREKKDLQIELEKEMFNRFHGRSTINPYDGMTPKEKQQCDRLYERLRELEDVKNESGARATILQIQSIQIPAIERVVKKRFKFNKHLFVSNRYIKMSLPSLTRMFKELRITSHQLRHTAIKNLIDAGVSINKVKAFSGHKTAQMVLRYAQPSFAEVADEIVKHKKF